MSELQELSKSRNISPYIIARVYAGLGDNDRALDLLERAVDARSDYPVFLAAEKRWDGLRSDPRFQTLLSRINFPR